MTAERAPTLRPDVGSRPVPDPTILSTEAINKAIANLRELFEARLEGMEHVAATRHDALNEAVKLAKAEVDKQPDLTDVKVQNLKELVDEKLRALEGVVQEKFASVGKQFEERDTRSERESKDNKVAVDAAFAAQKEAAAKQDDSNQKSIDKSEKGMAETVEKMSELYQTEIRSLNAQIGDLKGRVIQVEVSQQGAAIALGAATSNSDRRQGQTNWGLSLAVIVGLGVITLVIDLVNMFIAKH